MVLRRSDEWKLTISIAIYGFYNAYLHPLSRYPGPKLWAAYRLFFVIKDYQGLLPFEVLKFHRKYGPVVRIAPNELAFTDASAWDSIQGRLPDRRQNVKDFDPYGPLQQGHDREIIHANDVTHARLRRIYGPAFTPKAVEEQTGMLLKYADLLVTSLKKAIAINPTQDLSSWYNYTTFDLTGEFAFDEPFHCLDQGGKDHFFIQTVCSGTVAGHKIAQLERYWLYSMLKPFIPKSAFQAKFDMDAYTEALVDRRRERGYVQGRTDVMNYLLQNKNEEDRLSRGELVDNAVVLVVAGSETTATLLTGTTWQLCKNSDKYRKVVDEVRSAFKTGDEIIPKTVNDLPYMLAVLSETMRIFPPTGFGFPRIITSERGQDIAGHHVPKGTHCAVFHYAAYRYEHNFTRPEDFIPERWLPNAPSEFANDAREVLQPFHTGPRGCLGKNLAYAEMRLLLAKMLFHFDFELADPNEDWFGHLKAFSVWDRTSLMIRLKPVQR